MSVGKTPASGDVDHAAFGARYLRAQARLFRRNVLVAATVYVAFLLWDLIVAPEWVDHTLPIRAIVFTFCVLLFTASGRPHFQRFYNWYYVVLLAGAALSVAAILRIVPGGFLFGLPGVLICIAASSVLFRARAGATAVSGALATIGTLALMVLHGEEEYLVRSSAVFLVTAVGFAVLHAVQAERSAYAVYAAEAHLKEERARTESLLADITTMREERLSWLENLARFLRHELSNQIVAVSTSIELARDDGSPFGTQTYLARAQRSLGRMRGLVSSATEATSLEAALAVEENERVDLSGVVVDRVSTFQQLHPSRAVTVELRPGITTIGSEERLAQMLDKLLHNALEHSPENAEIWVVVRRAGDGWIELAVENEGDRLPEDKKHIFEAFVSTQKRSNNLGLGLFVAQSIARSHGGSVRAEDLEGRNGARFVVRLPPREARVDVDIESPLQGSAIDMVGAEQPADDRPEDC